MGRVATEKKNRQTKDQWKKVGKSKFEDTLEEMDGNQDSIDLDSLHGMISSSKRTSIFLLT